MFLKAVRSTIFRAFLGGASRSFITDELIERRPSAMKAITLIVQGYPIDGWSLRKTIGYKVLPMLPPAATIPIANARFEVK